jgi:hypothetical protein
MPRTSLLNATEAISSFSKSQRRHEQVERPPFCCHKSGTTACVSHARKCSRSARTFFGICHNDMNTSVMLARRQSNHADGGSPWFLVDTRTLNSSLMANCDRMGRSSPDLGRDQMRRRPRSASSFRVKGAFFACPLCDLASCGFTVRKPQILQGAFLWVRELLLTASLTLPFPTTR